MERWRGVVVDDDTGGVSVAFVSVVVDEGDGGDGGVSASAARAPAGACVSGAKRGVGFLAAEEDSAPAPHLGSLGLRARLSTLGTQLSALLC